MFPRHGRSLEIAFGWLIEQGCSAFLLKLLCFCVENGAGLKIRGTVTQSIKTLLMWKFWIQDLLHEPKVLPVSFAHLVACMGWAHAKDPKEANPYPPNNTFSISLMSHMGLGHA